VRRRWQLAHRTSQAAISAWRRVNEQPWFASVVTLPCFAPTWSKSRTTKSRSAQSTHLEVRRTPRKRILFRARIGSPRALRSSLSRSTRHDPERVAVRHRWQLTHTTSH
jgi:hypothetical protein